MKIVNTGPGPSPVVPPPGSDGVVAPTTPLDLYGAFSVQWFADGNVPLKHTHADAQGWLDYLKQFHPMNF